MRNFVRVLFAIVIAASFTSCSYNSIVEADENINAQWAKVENQYQRRADLVPNLVNTVKGYASHESETLEAVVAARAKATQITVAPANLTEENLQKYQEAQGELSSALGKLLAITENYPDLKANQNFLELQAQLEGTENRIATERSRYTDAVNAYNQKIRKFPALITAKLFGFDPKPQFKAEESAAQAPVVEF
ncbi:LemA family protein [Barnesiella viscericola DSM 18177]|uniref:LemA family protein n=1 Tax=Barnesiella viscericola DSM 18177 TaxID=880074 RepID=W0EN80_9BACT|nr:LemA family protein [Barnesiella viscericola]AHF12280.1 LemA family protein [Barnesiella viscericola DSM 18177]